MLAPELGGISLSRWEPEPEAWDPSARYAGLKDTIRALRQQHAYDRQQTREQLKRVRTARVRMNVTRQRITQESLLRRHPPSS